MNRFCEHKKDVHCSEATAFLVTPLTTLRIPLSLKRFLWGRGRELERGGGVLHIIAPKPQNGSIPT